jgi:hypothetical protein
VYAVEGRPEFYDQWGEMVRAMPPGRLSMVEWWTADVKDFSPPAGKIDIVSCLGLLYHVGGFMPKLRELSSTAELVLIEVQTGDTAPRSKIEKPDDRTKALYEDEVLICSPDLWERLIHRYFHDDFSVSRGWLTTYGDVYKVHRQGKHGHEFLLTVRAFYILTRNGSDIAFLIDDRTGCPNITSQPVKVYGDSDGGSDIAIKQPEIKP